MQANSVTDRNQKTKYVDLLQFQLTAFDMFAIKTLEI